VWAPLGGDLEFGGGVEVAINVTARHLTEAAFPETVVEQRLLCGRVVWTSSRAMKPSAPAFWASSASMRSDSRRSLSLAL